MVDILKYTCLKGSSFNDEAMSLKEQAPEDLNKFIQMIKNKKNFTIVKFGDGEWLNMISVTENERNCDGNNYFRSLGDELVLAYIHFLQDKNTFIARWHCQTYEIQRALDRDFLEPAESSKFLFYDILIHKYPFLKEQIDFFKEIRDSPRNKIYVSNIPMVHTLLPFLNINVGIIIPAINCYLYKNEIVQRIKANSKKDTIVLFSCGMASKVIIKEVSNEDTTCIDIGSTFDGLVRWSRDYNASNDYKTLLINAYK